MTHKLLHVGFGNMVVADRVIAIINSSSAPVRRLREESRDAGILVDATEGRKTRAILIMDSRHVVLSAIQPETIAGRFEENVEESKDG